MSKQRRLGKGIDALLQGRDITQLESGDLNSVVLVPLDQLTPNPDQPRKHFAPEALEELARSIGERGIIQPILAEQQSDGSYVIIAGERRYRAASMAGLTVVPVLPGVFSEEEKLEIALIENIQRQDLTPLEEARAYRDLMERSGLSQEELARRLGKSRPAVANSVRLLKLPEAVQERVEAGALSAGHARTLLAVEDTAVLVTCAAIVEREGFSVRQVERLIGAVNGGMDAETAAAHVADGGATTVQTDSRAETGGGVPGGTTGADDTASADSRDRSGGGMGTPRRTVEMAQIEQELLERLGTRVTLTGTNDRGRIEISYLSMDDLDRIVAIIVGADGSPHGSR